MAELTRQDIKEVLVESLEPFTKAVQDDFQKVNERLDNIEGKIEGVESRLSTLEANVKWIKDNTNDLFTKLDEFISLYKKQEQELEILANQVKKLEKRIAELESRK